MVVGISAASTLTTQLGDVDREVIAEARIIRMRGKHLDGVEWDVGALGAALGRVRRLRCERDVRIAWFVGR